MKKRLYMLFVLSLAFYNVRTEDKDFVFTKDQIRAGLLAGFDDDFVDSAQGKSVFVLVNRIVSSKDVYDIITDATQSFMSKHEVLDRHRVYVVTASHQAIDSLVGIGVAESLSKTTD